MSYSAVIFFQVLSAWSPVFMAMFASSFLEAEQGKVNLSGKRSEERRVGKVCRSRWSP